MSSSNGSESGGGNDSMTRLAEALRHRVQIIADREWAKRDPSGHLDALRQVSGEIDACVAACGSNLSPRLSHFLERRSYEKALTCLETGEAPPHEHHAH